MSKNIVIQEGGQGKQLTVDKLKTNLVGGGTCLWVPEDETRLGTKYISQNGTYKASDDGLYGYSEVTVSGVGSVTGKDPATGEDVRVTKDPNTGEIVETVLPTDIQVTTLPTKTQYTEGETINYAGIIVHAYSSTGRDLGEIPFNQLVFPITTAHAGDEREASSDLFCGIVQPFPFSSTVKVITNTVYAGSSNEYHMEIVLSGASFAVGYNEGNGFSYYPASAEPGQYTERRITRHTSPFYEGPPDEWVYATRDIGGWSYTYDNKKVYYSKRNWSGINISEITPVSSILIDAMQTYAPQIAWTMIYGDITGGKQALTVQWNPPEGGRTLESSFEISVT